MPVVASNLVLDLEDRLEPIGQTSTVREVNGVRIAIFGLIDRATLCGVRDSGVESLHLQDPLTTAAQLVPNLRSKAEVVILLSQLDRALLAELLTTIPGIDVAIVGSSAAWVAETTRIGSTYVQETGIRGQFAGVLHLIVAPDGRIIDACSDNRRLDLSHREDGATAMLCETTLAARRSILLAERRGQLPRSATPRFTWRDPTNGLGPPPVASPERRRRMKQRGEIRR